MKIQPLSQEKIASLRSAIATGNRLFNTGAGAVENAAELGTLATNAAARALAPAAPGTAGPIFNALGRAGSAVMSHPAGRALTGAALLGAPILSRALNEGAANQENQLMGMRLDPSRTVTAADLSTFLEKVAAGQMNLPLGAAGARLPRGGGTQWAPAVQNRPPAPQLPGKADVGYGGEFMKGVGNSVGKSLTDTVMQVVLNGASALGDFLVNDGKRKKLVDSLCRTDPMLVDAIKRDPKQSQHIMEAYQTLVRFAPGLSLDPNAVRSFLHEAVLSGGSINYATVKNLVDTQRSIADVRGF